MNDKIYMQRCLDLASIGIADVSPNPMVGCVIVHENIIIGEGYHQKIGEAHAEVNAIRAVFEKYGDSAPDLLKNATAYVNLEPCAHFGKTPPCADLLVKHQLKSVVIGNTDPFASVNGQGIAKLEAANIAVKTGVLAEECSHLNRRFLTRIKKQRPYIILKWAQTADGYFAPNEKQKKWITGQSAQQMVHQWRSIEDAVLIGKNTALIDNPMLNTRLWPGKSPIRIVIDRNLEIPHHFHLFEDGAKTIIFNEVKTAVDRHIHYIQMEDMSYYLPQKIAFQLYLMDIQSVMIEGGVHLLNQFIQADLWDEARVFKAKITWGDGLKAPELLLNPVECLTIGSDELNIYIK